MGLTRISQICVIFASSVFTDLHNDLLGISFLYSVYSALISHYAKQQTNINIVLYDYTVVNNIDDIIISLFQSYQQKNIVRTNTTKKVKNDAPCIMHVLLSNNL